MLSLDEIKQRLAVHEGFRSKPYRCTANKLTIGIGRNIEDRPFTEEELRLVGKDYMTKGITKSQAFAILTKDILNFDAELKRAPVNCHGKKKHFQS
jgi:GH24 family phage-related lysozyme (muramidase)